nr:hypothetical protein [Tanacetum cinerariifolium]
LKGKRPRLPTPIPSNSESFDLPSSNPNQEVENDLVNNYTLDPILYMNQLPPIEGGESSEFKQTKGLFKCTCTQLKRQQNSDYFKDKMLLMQAQENSADECDAFNSDVDDEPTTQSICMANLSSAGPTNQQAGPSNASILSEVHDLENAIDPCDDNQDEHEIHNEVQQKNIIDSTMDHMGNSNVTPYEQYLSLNDVSVVPSYASSVLNDAYVLHDNDAYVPHNPLVTERNIYKEQVAIYEQRARELWKDGCFSWSMEVPMSSLASAI